MTYVNMIIIDGLSFAIPLFIMAIGGIYCERSGVTNLAVEGFQGMGAFTGALAATLVSGFFAADSQVPMVIASFSLSSAADCMPSFTPCFASNSRQIRSSAAWTSIFWPPP